MWTPETDHQQPGSVHRAGDYALPRDALRFRDFVLLPGQRMLLKHGSPVEIGSRAFDLLLVLLRSRGMVVQKREIVANVWPSLIVDESNLRFQMGQLRRVLGRDRDMIKTVQGRGYMFVAAENGAEAEIVDPARPIEGTSSPTAVTLTHSSNPSGQVHVAVIEDDDDTREALQELLRSFGWSAHCFGCPREFMASGAARIARCVVLDVCLPGSSGLDAHLEMRHSGITCPVIFISGHADVPMSVRAMKAGAVEFLTKPIRHEELLKAIATAVADPVLAA